MTRMGTWKKNRLFFPSPLNGMIEDPTLPVLYLTTHTVRCTVYVVDTEYRIVSGALHTVNMMFLLAFI